MLHWNKVKSASAYTVEIGDKISFTTRETSYSLESLEPGDYIIRVRAIDYSEQNDDSDFAEFKFTRERESGLKYKLNSARDGYELIGIGDATGDIVMEDYYRGKPVTAIAKSALRRNGRITSFVVGKNVKTIGDNAFAACSQMTSITLPEGLVTIGENVFQSCEKLQTITLPNSLENIAPYTFSMCKGLESVVVGSNVKSIGKYAFADCIRLQRIEISNGVETLCEYAFSGCVAMSDVAFGDNLKTIERYAFYGCSALRTVALNNHLQVIDEGAFQSCGLTSLTLPDSVTTVGLASFASCSALEELTLGAGLTSIGVNAFSNTPVIDNYDGDIVIIGDWILTAREMAIEEYTCPENIIGIADAAFAGNEILERVELPNVKYIGYASFNGCPGLWEVVIGDAALVIGEYSFAACETLWQVLLGNSVHTIGSYAFAGCKKLEDSGINIPASVTTIGTSAFIQTLLFTNNNGLVYVDDWVVDCNLGSNQMMMSAFIKEGTRGIANYACCDMVVYDGTLFIPDSVELIGRGAFYKNTYLKQANLPANLKYIGEYAFTGCASLSFGEGNVIRIPMGCEYIGDHAFRDCMSLVSLYVPGSVKYIGNRAFKNCTNLGFSEFKVSNEPNAAHVVGDVVIGEGVEFMGEQAFYNCIGLQNITLPNSLKELGGRAFYKCEKLENLTIGTGIKEIPDYTFYNCSALKELYVPGNVRTIGKYAFRGCDSLRSIVLCEGVETIQNYAFFKSTRVHHLTIADSVTYIGDFAFRSVESLQAIYLHENLTYVGKLAFHGAKSAVIYVESAQMPETWAARWNGSFIPVVWGAKLSEDNAYIVSWSTENGKLENLSSFVSLVDPTMRGYSFAGWSTVENDTVWQYADLSEVPKNTTVYPVWSEGEQEFDSEESTLPEASAEPTV